MTYCPLAHLPRSMVRQRWLQKGNSGSAVLTGFLQIGQRTSTVFTIRREQFKKLENSGDQIVIVRFYDLTAIKLAGSRILSFGKVVHEDLAIDFGRVHGGASFE
jgi:hypothetical protein